MRAAGSGQLASGDDDLSVTEGGTNSTTEGEDDLVVSISLTFHVAPRTNTAS